MVLSDIEKIVKNVVEDNGYDRSSVNIVRSNYLATIILKSGVNLSLKKENMRYRGSDTCYVLWRVDRWNRGNSILLYRQIY